jgi:hypothetical protein
MMRRIRRLFRRQSKHIGFWLDTDYGPAHVLGDPNMSQETRDALAEVVKAAHKYMEERESEKGEQK